jgi:phosphohistidine phosphatase
MARQLWLLRHAEAEPHGTRPDAERRLTERGERQARLAGLALARIGASFGTVLTSPKERALRTATLALQAWEERADGEVEHGALQVHGPLAEGFDAAAALAAIAPLGAGARLLLVGHEPDFSGIVAALTGARVDLKKAGLAVVRLASAPSATDVQSSSAEQQGIVVARAGGELLLLLRPAELALLASPALAEL